LWVAVGDEDFLPKFDKGSKRGSFDREVLAPWRLRSAVSSGATRHVCDIVVNFVGFVTRLRILRFGILSL
ncbi:hypothetical protein ACCS33_38720, partial [Rhizobium ruizarguesonis]